MVSAYSGNILRKYGNALYPEETLGGQFKNVATKLRFQQFSTCVSPQWMLLLLLILANLCELVEHMKMTG